jgi:hypothetical protein
MQEAIGLMEVERWIHTMADWGGFEVGDEETWGRRGRAGTRRIGLWNILRSS